MEAVLAWVRHDPEARGQCLAPLMDEIQVECLSGLESVNKLMDTDLLAADPHCVEILEQGLEYHELSAEDKVETMVENIEIMQRRLLIQLMRLTEASRGGPQLACEECEQLSDLCCQADSGWGVMADVVRVNLEAVWFPCPVRAVNSLRYQVTR